MPFCQRFFVKINLTPQKIILKIRLTEIMGYTIITCLLRLFGLRIDMKRNKEIESPTDLTEKAYMGIRQMLFHGEIVPGQKIAYKDLSNRLGMSNTPVIHALKWLEYQGLVRREHNRGYYTEPIRAEEIEEIFESREIVEVSLIPKTIERLDEKGVVKLKKALEESVAAEQKMVINERLITNMGFHMTLASLSGCGTRLRMLRSLFDLLYLKYRGAIVTNTLSSNVTEEHTRIFKLITDRKTEECKKALSLHILDVKEVVVGNLQALADQKREFVF